MVAYLCQDLGCDRKGKKKKEGKERDISLFCKLWSETNVLVTVFYFFLGLSSLRLVWK